MDQDYGKNKRLEAALGYQKIGFSIIPVGADKKPLIDWKLFQTKRALPEEIIEWWTRWPQANPALVTGKISGVVVLDLDLKHGRHSSEFSIPATTCAKSGNGGEHFYFKHGGSYITTKSAISGPGVDMRGDGGYVLLPPSENESGGIYEWILSPEEGFTNIPEWLLEKTNTQEKKWLQGIAGVSEGSRNDTAASICGKIFKYLPISEWDTFGYTLFRAWNTQNTPPLPEGEIKATFESIKSLEIKTRSNEVKEKTSIGNSMGLNELLNTKFPDARFIVEQFFETGTINMLSAPPNKWKSWIVISCAICVASGKSLFGKFMTEKQAVLVVNEEDNARLLQERCTMLMDETESLPIYFYIGKEIKLDTNFVDQIINEATKKGVKFIIFDSLRSVHDADENSSQEMQKIMNQLKRITHTGMTVLFTHHNRKKPRIGNSKDDSGEESRGSSAINAAIHGHLSCDEVEREGVKYLVIHQPKLKAAAKIPPFEVRIENNFINKKMRFLYDGEKKDKEIIINQMKDTLLRLLKETDEWMGVKDMVAMEVSGDTTIRAALRLLETQRLIRAKNRKDVVTSKLPMRSQEGQHNEKLYSHLAPDELSELEFQDFEIK